MTRETVLYAIAMTLLGLEAMEATTPPPEDATSPTIPALPAPTTSPSSTPLPLPPTIAPPTTVPAAANGLSITQLLQGLLSMSQSLLSQLEQISSATPASPAPTQSGTTTTATGTMGPPVPREETIRELRLLYQNDPSAFFELLMGVPPKTTPPPTTTTTTARPLWPEPNCENPRLSNELRKVFLNTHNNLRGSVARGQTERSMGWGTAPPAALMYRMKYNCDAESHAQQYVSTCRTNGLPEYTHAGYTVNRHVLNNVQTDQAGAAQNAMASWWGELARHGIRSNMMFFPSEYSRGANNVLNWSKMAWWNNVYLGCAVQHCGWSYYTACMYRPGGNNANQYVYKVGAVCSDCPKGQCDYQALCHW